MSFLSVSKTRLTSRMNYQQMQQPAFNPFRQSMMMPQQTGFMPPQMTGFPGGMQQQPFLQPQQTGAMAFGNQQPMFQQQQQSQPFQQTQQQPFMQPAQTGFQPSQTGMQPQQTGFLQPQATGANPFRQSMMVNANNLGGAFSQPTSPFGQSSSPSIPSQIQRPGSTPANPLVSQPTGSKNPFAPAPGQAQKAATISSRGPTMNELAMGFGRDQGQGQQQSQNQSQSPWATVNGKSSSSGTGMADVASSFVFNDSSKSNNNANDDFMAQFGSLSVNTSNTGPSSSANQSQSSPFSQFNPSSAFGGSGSQNQSAGSFEFLQPQQTGYGGSNVKPFKPTSSFGSQLLDGLAPVASPANSPGVAASPQAGSGGIQSQMTGFPGMGQQPTGAGAGSGGMGQFGALGASNNTGGGMMSQNTGMVNPFRQNTMPTGGGGMGNPQFGQPPSMAFGINSPFAGQNQPSQGQGQGQGQNSGQGFGGQQGGSLI
jgi:hypothetical protein